MSEINVNSIDKESGSTLTLGGAGTTVAVHASATTSGFDSGLASVQIFTSSGTWTKPSGITKVIVEVQGGGGSGIRSSTGTTQNGGGGGGYTRKVIDVSSISTATVTVGAGGAGSTSVDTAGVDGGNSIWSDGTNTLTGSGGAAAPTTDYTPGVGGTASGGDLNISGGVGGMTSSSIGGGSILGYAGLRQHHAALVAGCDGVLGGGGSNSRSAGPSRGGNGGDGIVIVTEYK